MTDPTETLLPTDPDDVAQTLRHALLFDGRKRFDASREQMATITAAHLLDALRQSGFIILRRPVRQPRNDWPTGPKAL